MMIQLQLGCATRDHERMTTFGQRPGEVNPRAFQFHTPEPHIVRPARASRFQMCTSAGFRTDSVGGKSRIVESFMSAGPRRG